MKRALLIALLFLLPGCTSTGGRGSRLLPWNWFSPDHASQLEAAQHDTRTDEKRVTDAAHRDLRNTVDTLQQDPAPNKYTRQALHFSLRGLSLFDQVQQVPFDQAQSDHQLVLDLLSENAEVRANALKLDNARAIQVADLTRDLNDSRAKETELTGKLQESDRKYQAEAAEARKWKFYIIAAAIGWVVLQALSGLSRFYPALAPVSKAASIVAAPALHAAYTRVTAAAGQALAAAEKVSASAAQTIREHLDAPMDAADQQAIKAHYETASRK